MAELRAFYFFAAHSRGGPAYSPHAFIESQLCCFVKKCLQRNHGKHNTDKSGLLTAISGGRCNAFCGVQCDTKEHFSFEVSYEHPIPSPVGESTRFQWRIQGESYRMP